MDALVSKPPLFGAGTYKWYHLYLSELCGRSNWYHLYLFVTRRLETSICRHMDLSIAAET